MKKIIYILSLILITYNNYYGNEIFNNGKFGDTLKTRKNYISVMFGNQFNYREFRTYLDDGLLDFKINEKPSNVLTLEYARTITNRIGIIYSLGVINHYLTYKTTFGGEFENVKEINYKAGYVSNTVGIYYIQRLINKLALMFKTTTTYYYRTGKYFEIITNDNLIFLKGKSYYFFNDYYLSLNAGVALKYKILNNINFCVDIGANKIFSGSLSKYVSKEFYGLNIQGGLSYEF